MLKKQILQTIQDHRKGIFILIMLNLIIPPLEIGVLGLIYLILSGTNVTNTLNIIGGYVGISFSLEHSLWPIVTLALATLVIIIIWAFLRLYRTIVNAKTRYNILTSQEREVVSLYFSITGNANLKENPEETSNLLLQLSGALAAYMMAWIGVTSALTSILMMSITAMFTNPIITSLAIALGIISIIINSENFKRMQSIGQIKVATNEEMLYEVNQNIRGFEIVKFDNLKHVVMQKMNKIIEKDKQWRVDKRTTGERVGVLSDSFGLISLLSIISISIMLLSVPVETLLILILMFSRLRSYTSEFQTHWVNTKEYKSGTYKLIDAKNRFKRNSPVDQKPIASINSIILEDVSFAFDEELILNNISMEVSKGDQILITGQSGNGKSTLLKLIAGYYHPNAGDVNFRSNISDCDQSTTIKTSDHIFYASNEMYLPNVTLRDFIDPQSHYYELEIENIIRRACLEELLEDEHSLKKPIGDNGCNLSLGQRQRLIIARIYTRQPSVVILDEVTSNLDDSTEKRVLNNLIDYLNSETIILVSSHHRPPILSFNKTCQLSPKGIIEASTL
ncbi:MAG: hypothetical protein CMF45_00980 [Legionellales bacterium]|nr:hypothetical protein [Legionellales bacterium]|tara:strand:- start:97 stop:1788 length:1692 start_codon:yes stop_codon:yes gene_type:complete